MSVRRLLTALALPACLACCATSVRAPYDAGLAQSLPARMELVDVPFFPQHEYQCGPAALATVLVSVGVAVEPQKLEDDVYVPARRGSLQLEMLGATRRAGIVPYVLEPHPDALLREVAAGHPVVVLQNLRFDFLPQWHYAVVVGYDFSDATIVMRSGTERRLVVRMTDFERDWAKAQRWAFVALPPDRLPATAREPEFLAAVAAFERVSPAGAAQAYETALAAWPNDLFAVMALGNIAYREGRLDDAEIQYKKATIEHPDAADAWNNLAQVLYEKRHFVEARAAASRAVALGGVRRATYQRTLATIEVALAGPP